MGSLSIGHWILVLLIVVVIFGSGKLKNLGKDGESSSTPSGPVPYVPAAPKPNNAPAPPQPQTPQKDVRARAQELKAQGVSKEEAAKILQAEGY